jgi:eukaryotic-like serine/threonine-protein kinase
VRKLILGRSVLAAVAVAAVLAALAGAGPAGAAARSLPPRSAPAQSFSDWPMFHDNAQRTGVSPETAISTTTAPSLTKSWSAKLGTKTSSSPVVATSATLGKALVYATDNNKLYAYPAAGGSPAWIYDLPTGSAVIASPAVFDGVVYVADSVGTLYAVNASAGALECSFATGAPIQASPVVVSDPDGSGPLLYDGTLAGGTGGAEWAIYGVGNTHGGCTEDWKFTGFVVSPGGTWSPPAYGTDEAGVPLLVFGSKDDDDSVYALNANTGALVWRYRTSSASESDVGAAPTISPPGNNGFADGVAYVTGKDRVVYALNLTTGSLIWKYALVKGDNGSYGDVSSAALSGTGLYVGSDDGMYALNAVTGTLIWHVLTTSTFYGSPAVTGPAGGLVLVDADNEGHVFALNLATGATLFTVKPNSGFWASAAVSQGAIYVVGLNGVLYSYKPAS